MTLYDLLERLNLEHLAHAASEEEEAILNADIQVHFQPSYPLRGTLENVRMMDGNLVFAAGEGYNYGTKRAWLDECDDAKGGDE